MTNDLLSVGSFMELFSNVAHHNPVRLREARREAEKSLIIQNAVFLKILKMLTMLSVTLQKLPSKFIWLKR